MSKFYSDGRRISLGDNVLYGGEEGQIVFLIEEGAFLPGFDKGHWEYRNKGIGIQLKKGTLYCLDEPDEDLMPHPPENS